MLNQQLIRHASARQCRLILARKRIPWVLPPVPFPKFGNTPKTLRPTYFFLKNIKEIRRDERDEDKCECWHTAGVVATRRYLGFFGRPFVKRFALCYRTVVSLSCPVLCVLIVTLVYCGQTVARIKMKLCMQVRLGPGHIVLDGTQVPLPQRSTAPQFSAHVYCTQTAGWIKMSLGRKVGLYPSDIVLDGDPAPPFPKRDRAPIFGPCLL